MSNNRRQRVEIHHQGVHGPRSHHRKPPHGSWQPAVPSWEKRFCYLVGSVPWRKLLDTKRSMYLYENVVQWNDSAGEEAFHNAKSRFWAEINDLPCNISLPDPDVYIDKIDWDSNIDPELLLDLEREPRVPDERDKGEHVVILGNSLLLNQQFSCIGWEEPEEGLQKAPNLAFDPSNENPWESNVAQGDGAMKDNGRAICWNDSCGWDNNYNEWDNNYNYNEWDSNTKGWKNVNNGIGGGWETCDGNSKKRDGAGWYASRCKSSRFHGDDYQMDHGWWKNGRGRKKVNYIY